MNFKLPLTLALTTALSLVILAQEKPELSFKATKVADGLFMLEGVGGFTGGNLGLSTGDDGVILIDDGLPPLSELIKSSIAKLTDKSVDYVINTHVHGDHIGGNIAMTKAGATIVAHDNIRKRLVEDGMQMQNGKESAPREALPVLTFSDSMTFHMNGNEAFVFHAKHAHTDGDAIIHFPKADVIHTGDIMFNGLFPFIDLNSGGSVDGYIKAQERILSLCGPDTKIIPGHGPLASKADLEASVAMLKDSREKVAALLAKGMSEDEIVKANPLAGYHDKWNWGFISTERMTRTLVQGAKK